MRRVFLAAALLLAISVSCGWSAEKVPWWKQQKLQFMWGQWDMSRADKSKPYSWNEILPRELFRNVAQAGGTVFVASRGYRPENAQFAHEFGLKYFATKFMKDIVDVPGRNYIQENGEEFHGSEDHVTSPAYKCPLDESVYDKVLVQPHIEGIKAGLIDGIHTDWEYYSGNGDAQGVCYCDDCFARIGEAIGIKEALPEKTKRFPLLKARSLTAKYEKEFRKRRVAMFAGIANKLRAANPELMITCYGQWLSDFTKGMHTPENPIIVLDPEHYYNDDRQPWWESYSARLKAEGYIYIPGGWTNALFGAQVSQVSAARWIYEAMVNEDGCWLWFERELDDEILRAYSAADRQVKTVEGKVGKFLFNGKKDFSFVTAVEWSGRPELAQAVITRTYHLGAEHLTHVNNVNTDWPLRARIKFPKLTPGKQWTVRDPIGDLYYSADGKSATWTTAQLIAGVVVSMEPRSDLFLQVSPADTKPVVDASGLIESAEFDTMLDHSAASTQAPPPKAISGSDGAVQAGPKNRAIYAEVMRNSIYGDRLQSLTASAQKVFDLPKSGWQFKMDPGDIGPEARWFLPQSSPDGQVSIETESLWGDKGGVGAGWYFRNIDIPTLPEGKRVYLHFGAVDEQLAMWIDGNYAGDYDRDPDSGWDQPFAIDVTSKLTPGKHHLALRVHNSRFGGGIWKPVSLLAGPALADQTPPAAKQVATVGSGRLAYTATEPIFYEGGEGKLTIGNAIRALAIGGSETSLRQLRGHLWSPTYSPDGKRIAFVHDAGGRGQIFTMGADGTGAVNISNNKFCDRSPVWSPDGKRIAFLSDRGGDWDIWVMNPDGSGQKKLAGDAGFDYAPAWSPDGKQLMWESYSSGSPSIWVCNSDGKNPHPLIPSDRSLMLTPYYEGDVQVSFPDNWYYLRNATWSPDSKQIAAVGLFNVIVVDADGSKMQEAVPWMMGMGKLAWSPDGTMLAGTARTAPAETERSGVFMVKPGKQEIKWLVETTPTGPRLGGAQRQPVLNTWYSHGSAQPRRVIKSFDSLAWSPDSRTLAFTSDMDPTGAFYVYTVSGDGGTPSRLDSTRSAWPNEINWQPQP